MNLEFPSIPTLHDYVKVELEAAIKDSQTQSLTVQTDAYVINFLSQLKDLETHTIHLNVHTSTKLDSKEFEFLEKIEVNIPPELRSHGVSLKESDFFLMQSIFKEESEGNKLGKEAKHAQQIWEKNQILQKNHMDAPTFDQETKARSLLYQTSHTIKMSSTEVIAQGKFDQDIEFCIQMAKTTNDKFALRWLAYALFSGDRLKIIQHDRDSILIKSLIFLMNDPTSDINDIGDLLLLVYQARKETWSKVNSSKHTDEISEVIPQDKLWIDKANVNLSEPIERNSSIHFSHGGGLFYILQFLTGESPGYEAPTEYTGKGIFVSPGLKSGTNLKIDNFYANRYATHFDIPAALTAEIRAEYLGEVPNTYEAVLRNSNLSHLNHISISVLPFRMQELPPSEEDLANFISNKTLREKIQISIHHYHTLSKAKEEKDFDSKMSERKIQQYIQDNWPPDMQKKMTERIEDIQNTISLYGYYIEYQHGIPIYSLSVMNALEAFKIGLYNLPK